MEKFVQTIKRRRTSKSDGLEGEFRLDNMDDHRFYCGVLPISLRLMQTRGNVLEPIRPLGYDMAYYGESRHKASAASFMIQEIQHSRSYSLACPLDVNESIGHHRPKHDGWWWLSQDAVTYKGCNQQAKGATWVVFLRMDIARIWAEQVYALSKRNAA